MSMFKMLSVTQTECTQLTSATSRLWRFIFGDVSGQESKLMSIQTIPITTPC